MPLRNTHKAIIVSAFTFRAPIIASMHELVILHVDFEICSIVNDLHIPF